MASGFYTFGLQELMRGSVDLVAGDVSAVLVSSAYTPALSSERYQSEIPDASFIAEARLTSATLDGTAYTADPAVFVRPEADLTCAGVVIVKDTGNEGSSVLIAYLAITPFTTDGSEITLSWDTDGIFSL